MELTQHSPGYMHDASPNYSSIACQVDISDHHLEQSCHSQIPNILDTHWTSHTDHTLPHELSSRSHPHHTLLLVMPNALCMDSYLSLTCAAWYHTTDSISMHKFTSRWNVTVTMTTIVTCANYFGTLCWLKYENWWPFTPIMTVTVHFNHDLEKMVHDNDHITTATTYTWTPPINWSTAMTTISMPWAWPTKTMTTTTCSWTGQPIIQFQFQHYPVPAKGT